LPLVSHEVLRKFDQGTIASISDEGIGKLLIKEPGIPVMYFSRHAYDQAVGGFEDSDIDAILRKRLEHWAPDASGHGLNWIYEAERRCLTLTALSQASPSRMTSAQPADHFDQSLQLLVIISGEKRYQDWSLASVLVLVVEGEAKLRAEYLDAQEAARREGDSGAAERFANAVKRSESYARALGSSLKSLGRPEFSQGLLNVGLSRGVFIRPRDPDLVDLLVGQRELHVFWKDGLIADWALEDIAQLEKRGKSVSVLYFNNGQLHKDLHDLTVAQREREFARRVAEGRGGSMEARRDHLSSLWLEQHLLRRKALAQAKAHPGPVAAILTQQVAEEAKALQLELALFPAWLEAGEKPGARAFEILRSSEAQLIQDAKFFAALCRRDGDANGESLFSRISTFKPLQH
jgi:hypothetical protein